MYNAWTILHNMPNKGSSVLKMTNMVKYLWLLHGFYLFLVFGVAEQLKAQNDNRYYFEHLNNYHGLSSDVILDIIQDSKGFMWFCTEDGLNRYDGYTFKTYRKDYSDANSLLDNELTCIAEDGKQRLWIGTRNHGISIYDPSDDLFQHISTSKGNPRLPTNQVRALHIDDAGNTWIGTENYGILRITPDRELVIYRIKHRHLSNLVNVKSIFEDSSGRLWIGSWQNGLLYHDPATDDFIRVDLPWSPELPGSPVIAIHEDSHGRLWIGSWAHGLFIMEGSVEKGFKITRHHCIHEDYFESGAITISGDIVFSLDQDSQGNVWVGSNNGVAVFSPGEIDKPLLIGADSQSKYAPKNSQVYKIYTDKEGLLWMGTRGSGVHKVNVDRHRFFSHIIPYSASNIFDETAVFSLFDKCKDTLYVGIKSEGFYIYDRHRKTFTPYREIPLYSNLPVNFNTAYSFARDHLGRLWMGTRYQGIWLLDYDNQSVVNMQEVYSLLNVRKVYTLLLDVDNNMWAGTDQGLFIFMPEDNGNGPGYELLHLSGSPDEENALSGNHVTSIWQDSRSHYWIGTLNNGLNRFDGTFPGKEMGFEQFRTDEDDPLSLASDRVNDIIEDDHGRVWFGTEGAGGLSFYDPQNNAFVPFASKHGIAMDHVFGMLRDNDAKIWLSTNKGLIRMDVSNIENPEFVYFTSADGLQGNVYIRGARVATSDGKFFVGGYHGFNGFYPDRPMPVFIKPTVAITEVKLRNKEVKYNPEAGKTLVLSNKDKLLSVYFSVLSYKDPDNNRFAFKLEGFDEEWNYRDATNRQAVYTNLPRGKYTLHIKGANSNGYWNEETIQIDILVKPALMASNLAVVLYVLVFGLIVYGLIRLVLYRSAVRQQLQLEKFEQMKLEQIHQLKLRSFANVSHELLTPLSILNCIIDNKLSGNGITSEVAGTMKKNVNKLKRLIDQLMMMRKIDSGHLKLKVRKGDIRKYIHDTCQSFMPLAKKKDLQLAFNCEDDTIMGYFDHEKMEAIIQNLLSNAFKFTESGGVAVQCNMFYRGQLRWVMVTVQDTGCGIPEEETKNIFERFTRVNDNTAIPGIGIGLDLVKSLTILHKGNVDVRSQQGEGTRFKVEIPIEKCYFSSDEISEQPALQQHEEVEPLTADEIIPPKQQPLVKQKGNLPPNTKTLLLVEDNDDLRQELGDFLSGYYHTEQAEDGVVALEMAKYLSPDIIVSDVIMPKMDGFELCKQIKSNFETSHIPVILLTARTDDTSKSEGYSFGADSYLTKPVTLDLLLTRINGIMDARESLKEFYRRRCIFAPELSNINIPPLDETFIHKATEIIEQNIEDPGFSVQVLTQEMGTSNSMLYRKFNKLLGVTPNELIKNIRIKYAADLLVKGKYTVSEVAYSIGFSDLSYFGKCFKKEYGMAPSEYREQQMTP